ncbi:MAG: inositol monophosphatase [Phycisphaerales bacterium]|nr:inositol monophosphatase [Phycisphaerales bacterium]MCB9862145.1 inositol monophosphatase [Phycisphaerales bacterium]
MTSESTIVALRSFSRELALVAGGIAARYAGPVAVTRKDDDSPVTEADHAVQSAVFDAIARRYPDHAVIGEETIRHPDRHAAAANAQFCWVVDPIDGTRNFARGMSIYATSIAVMEGGAPIAGAIHDASTGYTYSAARGLGADRDGEPLRLSECRIGADTTVLVSSFRRRPAPSVMRDWMDAYIFRNHGSICLHLAWLAGGLADGAYALECRLWDMAAGALMIAEAGGVITRDDGSPLWPIDVGRYDGGDIAILAGSPVMHERLLESLRASRARD